MKGRVVAAALLSVAALGALGAPVSAQATDSPVQAVSSDKAPAREPDAPADRFGMIDGGQLQITSGTEEDNATFRIALPTAPSMATRFSLALSRPLDADDKAMPASLDALANGTRVTLSLGYFEVRVGRPDAARKRMNERARRLCRLAPAERETVNTERDQCKVGPYAVNKYLDAADRAFYQQQTLTPPATDFGIDATVGFNDFEWLDATTLLPQKKRHTDWSVAGHVAHYLSGSHTALTASVAYQRAFEASEEKQVCPPGFTDPAQCSTARTAAPSRNENLLLALGVRHRALGADLKLANLAIAPIVTYDVIDDVFGVDVPIYYTPDDKGGLNGGIRFGYRSDREKSFTIAFFVGTTFDVFGGR